MVSRYMRGAFPIKGGCGNRTEVRSSSPFSSSLCPSFRCMHFNLSSVVSAGMKKPSKRQRLRPNLDAAEKWSGKSEFLELSSEGILDKCLYATEKNFNCGSFPAKLFQGVCIVILRLLDHVHGPGSPMLLLTEVCQTSKLLKSFSRFGLSSTCLVHLANAGRVQCRVLSDCD